MQIAIGVEMTDIAGMQPAIDDGFGGLLRVLVITLHDEIAAYADLTGFSLWQNHVVVVHDLDANQGIGSADGGQPLITCNMSIYKVLARGQMRDGAWCFGLPVAFHHDWPEDLDRLAQLLDRHRRRTVEEVA
ncbi:hypothetical protein D3C85_1288730 [compost metagenome]